MDMQLFIVILLIGVLMVVLIKNFSRGRYGSLRPNLQTTNAYLSAQVDPGMRYYLSGPDLYPNAIIGIGKEWALESDLWKPVDLESNKLKELIFNIKSQGMGSGSNPYGYEIFDDRGGKIGDWFSLPGQNITVWIRGENRVELSTPAPPAPR
jgi:hypothetical protein